MARDRIGRYEVQRRLGTGGMGSLYLAHDPLLDRLIAIKLLKGDYQEDEALRERFAREARSVARLRHPNIVIVFDVGEDQGRPFMAMEYIAGETLTAVFRRNPPLPLVRRLALVEELCAGLAHAHEAGIVHRDVKPANLMLDGEGVLKILDFGIARLANSGMTQDGMMMGSVNYMSPEQIVGRAVDHRADIFATGAVLYEAIALEQAFPGAIDSGVLHRILEEGPVPLAQLVPGVDPELARIVTQALEREPERRYADVSVMRRDIARVRRRIDEQPDQSVPDAVGDRTIVVRPTPAFGAPATPSTGGRLGDSARRRRMDPERFAEIRRQQVGEHLQFSAEALARGDHDAALQHAERAAIVDPDNRQAFDLIDKARLAIESKAIHQLLGEASRLLTEGRVDDAAALADEASAAIPDGDQVDDLRRDVRVVSDQIAMLRERRDRIESSLSRARASIEHGGYETALRAVYEVLALDPERSDARELELVAKTKLHAQREHEHARRVAYDHLTDARALAAQNKFDDAEALIRSVAPPSDTVRLAVRDVLASVRLLQRRSVASAIVASAQSAMATDHFEEAISQINSIAADDLTDDAKALRTLATQKLKEQRDLLRRRETLDKAVAATEALISENNLTRAYERLQDAVGTGLDDERIEPLHRRIADLAAAAEAKRREEARDRVAAKRVEAARQLFANGDGYAAVALLERDLSEHPLVKAALVEIRANLAAEEERVRQEAERRRQDEEARRRAEEARHLEELRRQEEARRAEEARRLEEARRVEEARRAEEARRRAEEARLAEEARRAEQARLAEEARRLEEARKAENARREEEARRRAEEARRQEEERRRAREAEAARVQHEIETNTSRALECLDGGDLVGARRAVEAVLSVDAVNPAALRIREAIASETRRRDAEVARQEQERRQEAQRQQEEARQRQEEARRKEEETRLREVQVTKILKKARKTTADEDALELLNEALTLIPGDPRVQTLLVERRTAIENRRVEEQRQAEERAATVLRPPAPAAMRSRATPSQAVLGVIALVVLLGGIALWWRLSSAPEQQPDIAAAPNSSTPVNLPVPPAPTSPDASLLNALPPSAPPAASPPARQPQTTPTPPVTSPPSRSGAPTPSVVPPPSSPPAQPAPPVQPPPVVAPAPVPAPVVEPPPAPPATAPPPVVPPVVAPPVPAPVPPPVRSQPVVDDRAAIEQMFRGYEGAWASLDADSLRRVQDLSTADVARVRASMNDARQFQVTVQIRDVKLENDGRHATVTAGVRRMMIPKRDAKPTDISTTSTFSLEKRGDAWVIVALR